MHYCFLILFTFVYFSDFRPKKWETLFPQLLQYIQSTDQHIINRSLYTLHQILKELIKKRIAVSKQYFEQMGSQMIGFLRTFWMKSTEQLITMFSSIQGSITTEQLTQLSSVSRSTVLSMKCLHRIVVYGIANIQTSTECQQLFPAILQAFSTLLTLRQKLPEDSELHSEISLLLLEMIRTVIETQKEHALQFR